MMIELVPKLNENGISVVNQNSLRTFKNKAFYLSLNARS